MAFASTAYWPPIGAFFGGTTGGSFTVEDSANTTVLDAFTVRRTTSNASNGAAGIGVGFVFETENAAGATKAAAKLRATLTTATAAAEVGAFELGIMNAGAMPAAGSGQHSWNPSTYTINDSGNFPIFQMQESGNTKLTIFTLSGDVYFNGSGASKVMLWRPDASNVALKVAGNGSVVTGIAGAIATTATDGFLYIPSCAGTPTGAPTAETGKIPIVWDSTNHKLYVRSGGAWKGGTAPGAFT
jgi:hypothetical protein